MDVLVAGPRRSKGVAGGVAGGQHQSYPTQGSEAGSGGGRRSGGSGLVDKIVGLQRRQAGGARYVFLTLTPLQALCTSFQLFLFGSCSLTFLSWAQSCPNCKRPRYGEICTGCSYHGLDFSVGNETSFFCRCDDRSTASREI